MRTLVTRLDALLGPTEPAGELAGPPTLQMSMPPPLAPAHKLSGPAPPSWRRGLPSFISVLILAIFVAACTGGVGFGLWRWIQGVPPPDTDEPALATALMPEAAEPETIAPEAKPPPSATSADPVQPDTPPAAPPTQGWDGAPPDEDVSAPPLVPQPSPRRSRAASGVHMSLAFTDVQPVSVALTTTDGTDVPIEIGGGLVPPGRYVSVRVEDGTGEEVYLMSQTVVVAVGSEAVKIDCRKARQQCRQL